MLSNPLKSWLRLALFFSTLYGVSAYSNALQASSDIYLSDKWQALLHLKNGKPQIIDPKFLLSGQNFTPALELQKTIELINNSPQQAMCRFPARYHYLTNAQPLIDIPAFNSQKCPELQRYINYVPFDKVNLVFASEVIASASSMMGHTFLNVSGANAKGDKVSHSVSFFTEFSSFNPAAVFYDATVAGMDGYFIVRPFSVDIAQYIDKEGRNLWLYQLDLSVQEKKLLKLHIWELKDLAIKYLFQSYNCATLTLYLLSIAKPELKQQQALFVSPIDVAKATNQQGMISHTDVMLSKEWELNMLKSQLPENLHEEVILFFTEHQPLNLNLLNNKTQLVVKRYLQLLDEVNPQLWQTKANYPRFAINNQETKQLNFDLTLYKNPIKSAQDSALGISYQYSNKAQYVDFSFMPASHYLYGDNSQFFSESELKMGEITLQTNRELSNLSLQSLALYSMTSFMPSTSLNPKLSGEFFFGFKSPYNNQFEQQLAFELSGSLGKSWQIHRDILLYGLMGAGVGLKKLNDGYAYLSPKVGLMINMIAETKMHIAHQFSQGQLDSTQQKQQTSLTWSWHGMQNKLIAVKLLSTKINGQKANTASLTFNLLF